MSLKVPVKQPTGPKRTHDFDILMKEVDRDIEVFRRENAARLVRDEPPKRRKLLLKKPPEKPPTTDCATPSQPQRKKPRVFEIVGPTTSSCARPDQPGTSQKAEPKRTRRAPHDVGPVAVAEIGFTTPLSLHTLRTIIDSHPPTAPPVVEVQLSDDSDDDIEEIAVARPARPAGRPRWLSTPGDPPEGRTLMEMEPRTEPSTSKPANVPRPDGPLRIRRIEMRPAAHSLVPTSSTTTSTVAPPAQKIKPPENVNRVDPLLIQDCPPLRPIRISPMAPGQPTQMDLNRIMNHLRNRFKPSDVFKVRVLVEAMAARLGAGDISDFLDQSLARLRHYRPRDPAPPTAEEEERRRKRALQTAEKRKRDAALDEGKRRAAKERADRQREQRRARHSLRQTPKDAFHEQQESEHEKCPEGPSVSEVVLSDSEDDRKKCANESTERGSEEQRPQNSGTQPTKLQQREETKKRDAREPMGSDAMAKSVEDGEHREAGEQPVDSVEHKDEVGDVGQKSEPHVGLLCDEPQGEDRPPVDADKAAESDVHEDSEADAEQRRTARREVDDLLRHLFGSYVDPSQPRRTDEPQPSEPARTRREVRLPPRRIRGPLPVGLPRAEAPRQEGVDQQSRQDVNAQHRQGGDAKHRQVVDAQHRQDGDAKHRPSGDAQHCQTVDVQQRRPQNLQQQQTVDAEQRPPVVDEPQPAEPDLRIPKTEANPDAVPKSDAAPPADPRPEHGMDNRPDNVMQITPAERHRAK